MNKIISITVFTVLLLIALIFPGCTRAVSSFNGSGNIISEDIKVANFDYINAKGPFALEIVQSESFKVTLSTDDNLMNRIKLVLERKTLKMNIEALSNFFPTKLLVQVSMPQISGLNLSAGAKAAISGFKSGSSFSLFLADRSFLEGSLQADNASLHLSSGSTLVLSGNASDLSLTSSDGSHLDLRNFVSINADVKLEEASEAYVNVSRQFDVNLNGKSKLYFVGYPIFTNTSISDGSTMSMVR
jgi:hypothetical protein